VNRVLFERAWAAQRSKLLVVGATLLVWGAVFPIIYATFGVDFQRLVESGTFKQMFDLFSRFSGGNVFSLGGTIAFGLIHPITIALVSIFAIGFTTTAVAGERQRGTLEVILSRPISRSSLYLTLLAAMLVFVGVTLTAIVAGAVAGALLFGVGSDLVPGRLLAAWLNGVFLFAAIGGIGLAASVSFDRLTPALGITLAFTVASYAGYFLALLWPDAHWIGTYSIFSYFRATEILAGRFDPADLVVLAGVFAASVGVACVVFPRRDLAAPS
jgi:ABC-2 type transport system permease protein